MTQIIEDEDRIAYDEDLIRAVASANEGDATECARLVEGVTERLFPVDSDEDPVSQAGSSAMFKLMTYLLIDFCVEEEKELHAVSELAGFSAEHVVDEVEWIRGSVCLACIEHLFSELVRMKATRPHDPDRGDYLWTGPLPSESMDLLTLLTVTNAKLPWSPLRHLVMNANDALRAMAGSEKMLEGISSLALTSFSRFCDDDVEYRPNPRQMISKRLVQAVFGVRAFEEYLTSRGVGEGDLPAKDSDEVPDAIMAITRRLIWENSRHESSSPTDCFVPGRDGQGPTIGLFSHQLHFRRLPTV